MVTECIVDIEWSEVDKKVEKEMEDFMREGCGCKVLRDALDLVVMRQIMALSSTSDETKGRRTERKKCTVIFRHLSVKVNYNYTLLHHQVCKKTFLFLHSMGKSRFNALKRSYLNNGPSTQVNFISLQMEVFTTIFIYM